VSNRLSSTSLHRIAHTFLFPIETLAFHLTVLISALVLLNTRSFLRLRLFPLARSQQRNSTNADDASKGTTLPLPDDFQFVARSLPLLELYLDYLLLICLILDCLNSLSPLLIPLTLLLSSLPKLLLLLLLSIWPTPTDPPIPSSNSTPPHDILVDFLSSTSLERLAPILAPIAHVLAQETLDREWVIRNVLGGMGIGFGLRVLLMGRLSALETTSLVCVGWWGRWRLMEMLGDERGELKL